MTAYEQKGLKIMRSFFKHYESDVSTHSFKPNRSNSTKLSSSAIANGSYLPCIMNEFNLGVPFGSGCTLILHGP
jgi:hypothetical protein